VYILNSSTAALLTIASITWWATLESYFERPSTVPYLYLPVMAALVPYYISLYRKNASGNFLFLVNCFLSVSLLIVTAGFLQDDDDRYPWIFALYLLMLCIFYNVAHLRKLEDHPAMSKPFYFTGVIGILFILFVWSFEWLWKDWHFQEYRTFYLSPLPYLLLILLVVLFFMVRKNYRTKQNWFDHPLGFSIAVFLISQLFMNWLPSLGILLLNTWILCLGLLYIRKGGRQNHFGVLNFGLLIIGILAVCRFFDESIPFTWRGFFFLITGAGFFVANYLLIKKRKQLNQTIHP
jgi:hypothetical protein